MSITDEQRRALGDLVAEQRAVVYGTKAAAYQAARVNPATWDRIEAGEPVRADRLSAAIKVLWPDSRGDWRPVLEQTQQGRADQPQPDAAFRALAERVGQLEARVEALEAERRRTGVPDGAVIADTIEPQHQHAQGSR